MSSSGAPRKIEGMKSTNVWVIAIAVMKISRIVIGRDAMKVSEIRNIATRLMWIPGTRPVNVPARMPRRSGMASSSIVYFVYDYLGFVFVNILSALEFYGVAFFEVDEGSVEEY